MLGQYHTGFHDCLSNTQTYSFTFYLMIDGTVLQIVYSAIDSQPCQQFVENLRNRWQDCVFCLFSKLSFTVGPDPLCGC